MLRCWKFFFLFGDLEQTEGLLTNFMKMGNFGRLTKLHFFSSCERHWRIFIDFSLYVSSPCMWLKFSYVSYIYPVYLLEQRSEAKKGNFGFFPLIFFSLPQSYPSSSLSLSLSFCRWLLVIYSELLLSYFTLTFLLVCKDEIFCLFTHFSSRFLERSLLSTLLLTLNIHSQSSSRLNIDQEMRKFLRFIEFPLRTARNTWKLSLQARGRISPFLEWETLWKLKSGISLIKNFPSLTNWRRSGNYTIYRMRESKFVDRVKLTREEKVSFSFEPWSVLSVKILSLCFFCAKRERCQHFPKVIITKMSHSCSRTTPLTFFRTHRVGFVGVKLVNWMERIF